ncbi:MAG: type I restriction enzyme HsdR N-terminal domain-containing protein [Bacteroidetes bacterium]|nr:type I restriction enzyme HsdR N-terminal domain-containing protein [Bacteroidota bacterium]
MYKISKKLYARLSLGIKKFQRILESASTRDVNESDTVTIIVDILSDVLGYDRYEEITKEYRIRGTYCDLATTINKKINLLIEVKAIGIELKDVHSKQAVDYASNQGLDWVILTNGRHWKVYKVLFSKPIMQDLVYDFNFLKLNSRNKKDVELLFTLSKEGSIKSSLQLYQDQKQALNRFYLGALLLSDNYLNYIKRDLRKLSPDIKIDTIEIKEVLQSGLFKREVVESEKMLGAVKKIGRLSLKKSKLTKQTFNESSENNTDIINFKEIS